MSSCVLYGIVPGGGGYATAHPLYSTLSNGKLLLVGVHVVASADIIPGTEYGQLSTPVAYVRYDIPISQGQTHAGRKTKHMKIHVITPVIYRYWYQVRCIPCSWCLTKCPCLLSGEQTQDKDQPTRRTRHTPSKGGSIRTNTSFPCPRLWPLGPRLRKVILKSVVPKRQRGKLVVRGRFSTRGLRAVGKIQRTSHVQARLPLTRRCKSHLLGEVFQARLLDSPED